MSESHCPQTRVVNLLTVGCQCCVGEQGPRGPAGFKGEDGAEGKAGEDGQRGDAGWDGLSVGFFDYAEYYTAFVTNALTVPVQSGSTLLFNSTQVSPRGTFIRQQDPFRFIVQPGVYQISWRVPTASAAALQLRARAIIQEESALVYNRTTTGSNLSCQITNTILYVAQQETVISLYNPGQEFDMPTQPFLISAGMNSSKSDFDRFVVYNIVIACIANPPND